MDEQWARPDASPWPARLLALASALLVTGPALAPGFVLLRDMVFVPRQDLDLDALGLSGGLPRAVPVDAVMGLVTAVVPGDLVQKAVLLGTVFAAVLGAARLVPPRADGRRGAAAAVAGLVYGWSPYLAERLLMGHWTLLMAYAALPWIAREALRLRAGVPGALPRLVLVCAPAALTPTGAVLAAGVVLTLSGRRALSAGAAVLALSLPWIVAGALHPGGAASDPAGVAAFAARAEGWAGTVVSVLGTGGIWNAGAVPAGRGSALVPLVTLLLVALAVTGWCSRGALAGAGRRLVALGLLGALLACAAALPGGADLLELAVRVPGGGILRDAQKWAAWWALPLAVGAGLGARRLAEAARAVGGGRAAVVGVMGAAILVPLISVPDLAWGVGGRLQPVDYPADWQRVRDVLAEDDGPGDVLVLPFGAYRAFGWNDGRPQLDPAPRWLTRPTVVDDDLVVDGRTVEGEDPRARAVAAAADDPRALAELGIGWVLVERGTAGREVPATFDALPSVVDGEDLDLYRVPGAVAAPSVSSGRVTAVVLVHAGAAGVVLGAVLWIMAGASTVALRRRPFTKRVPE